MNSPSPAKIHKAKNTCARILTPKQVGPICWFMATFVAMFYSQRSRKKLLEASPNWDKKKGLFTLLKNVLDDKYLKTAGAGADGRDSDDYKKFSDNTFIDILKLLYKEDKRTFMYNPDANKGFSSHFYIGRLYKLLNIDYTIIEYDIDDDFMAYSLLNEEYNDNISVKFAQKYNREKKYYEMLYYKFLVNPKSNIEKFMRSIDRPAFLYREAHKRFNEKDKPLTPSRWFKDTSSKFIDASIIFNNNPTILIVFVRNDTYNTAIYGEGVYYKKGNNVCKNRIDDPSIKESIKSMDDRIFYRGNEYNLDAVILGDYKDTNKYNPSHIIAGITCKRSRYVYNGWTRTSMDTAMETTNITRDIPCELMKHKWNIKNNSGSDGGSSDYCLNSINCKLDLLVNKEQNTKLCFNFSEGSRILVYVKKDNSKTSSSSNGGLLVKKINKSR